MSKSNGHELRHIEFKSLNYVNSRRMVVKCGILSSESRKACELWSEVIGKIVMIHYFCPPLKGSYSSVG